MRVTPAVATTGWKHTNCVRACKHGCVCRTMWTCWWRWVIMSWRRSACLWTPTQHHQRSGEAHQWAAKWGNTYMHTHTDILKSTATCCNLWTITLVICVCVCVAVCAHEPGLMTLREGRKFQRKTTTIPMNICFSMVLITISTSCSTAGTHLVIVLLQKQ